MSFLSGGLRPGCALLACALIGSCESPPRGDSDVTPMPAIPLTVDPLDWRELPPLDEVIEPSLNTARAAARSDESRADLSAEEAWPTVSLHLALFEHAYEFAFERGWWSPALVIDWPSHGPAQIEAPRYALFILGRLVEKSPSLAWVDPDEGVELVRYPGRPAAATILKINVLGMDRARGLAAVEISVRRPGGEEYGRSATAMYDVQRGNWTLEFQPVQWIR